MVLSNLNTTPERQYFYRQDQELLRLRRKEEAARMQTVQDAAAKVLHWRKCPSCGHDMQHAKSHGIEVERCSSCHGVFFENEAWHAATGSKEGESFINVLHELLVGENPRT